MGVIEVRDLRNAFFSGKQAMHFHFVIFSALYFLYVFSFQNTLDQTFSEESSMSDRHARLIS